MCERFLRCIQYGCCSLYPVGSVLRKMFCVVNQLWLFVRGVFGIMFVVINRNFFLYMK